MLALQFRNKSGLTPASTHLSYVRDISEIGLGSIGFVVLAYLIVTATSNSTNLTDGLDGLAAGAAVMVFGAYTLITLLQYRNTCGNTPVGGCYYVRDPLDLALVAAAAMGACFGFLWWNAAPAQIFMGDTGSMSLGGLMAGLAILSHTELLLVVLAGLFAMVTLSGLIQAGWFKLTRWNDGNRDQSVQDGTHPPPLRGVGMGGGHDHRPVLDHLGPRGGVRDRALLRRVHRLRVSAYR